MVPPKESQVTQKVVHVSLSKRSVVPTLIFVLVAWSLNTSPISIIFDLIFSDPVNSTDVQTETMIYFVCACCSICFFVRRFRGWRAFGFVARVCKENFLRHNPLLLLILYHETCMWVLCNLHVSHIFDISHFICIL